MSSPFVWEPRCRQTMSWPTVIMLSEELCLFPLLLSYISQFTAPKRVRTTVSVNHQSLSVFCFHSVTAFHTAFLLLPQYCSCKYRKLKNTQGSTQKWICEVASPPVSPSGLWRLFTPIRKMKWQTRMKSCKKLTGNVIFGYTHYVLM